MRKPWRVARRVLMPGFVAQAYYLWKHRAFVSAKAEVELARGTLWGRGCIIGAFTKVKTGVAIAAVTPGEWILDSFLLSCRVIGKSVESALLARIAADARQAGAATLVGEFIDSGRNQVAATLLPTHGFGPAEHGRRTRSPGEPGPAWPDWIQEMTKTEAEAAR